MTDPYQILGVSPQATDDEVKSAYRKLSQQYSSDNQQDSVAEDIANQKMTEINAAYDEIMNMRRTKVNTSSGDDYFTKIRTEIEHGNYTVADGMLEGNRNDSNAEWNFLKGTVCLSRGWMNDAYSYFQKAVKLEPSNREYQMAFSRINSQRNGQMAGNPYGRSSNADNTANTLCNICQCMICADCLCNCF